MAQQRCFFYASRALPELLHGKGEPTPTRWHALRICPRNLPPTGQRISAFDLADCLPHELLDGVRTAPNSWRTPRISTHAGELSIRTHPGRYEAGMVNKRLCGLAVPFNRAGELVCSDGKPRRDRKADARRRSRRSPRTFLEAVLWQTVAHNSYHTGQIAMLRRMLGAWPPQGGGDTW